MTSTDKKKIEELIVELGGPNSTIMHLVETTNDKSYLEETIKYILSIRHVSKKTYYGDETIQEYFKRQKLNINID